jgi:hypothetical protein
MNTKPFPNSFGKEVQLTRDEYIQRWVEPTHQFAYIIGSEGSLEKLNDFQAEIIRLAGDRWDKE